MSYNCLDSKVYGANMGLIWGRQDPGGPRVGPWTFLSGYIVFLWKFNERQTNTYILLSEGSMVSKLEFP